MNLDGLEEQIASHGNLNRFDKEAVKTVSALIRRVREAQLAISVDGIVVSNDRGTPIENPACRVERGASAELRGWVKDRPDLFGEQRSVVQQADKFGGFKAVK